MTARAVLRPAVPRLPLAGAVAVVVGALLLFVAYLGGPSVFLTACASAAMWSVAVGRAERALALALPMLFRLAFAAGAFAFESPVQILDLAIQNVDPRDLIAQQHVWWPRYLISYPSILAMDHWGMRFDDAFALYDVALLPLTAAVMAKAVRTSRSLDEAQVFAVGIAVALLVGILATQMNGRLIPAHLGMGLILLAQGRVFAMGRLGLREAVLLGGGLVLGHMSSGTGLVAFAQMLVGSAVLAFVGTARRRVLALLWLLTVVLGPLLYRDLAKNVEFYGGDASAILNMLDHGAGFLLRRDPRILAAAVTLGVLLAAVLWRGRRRILATPRALWPAMIALPVTTIGGLFGYSTLTMGIPAAMIIVVGGALALIQRWQATSRD